LVVVNVVMNRSRRKRSVDGEEWVDEDEELGA